LNLADRIPARPLLTISALLAALSNVSIPLFANWKLVGEISRNKEIVLANLGYLGHMWELYAMWAWIPIFLLASFNRVSVAPKWASLAAFAVIGAGGIGSLLAGQLADKLGRTTLTIASLLISGACAMIVGFLFGGNPVALVAVCLIWVLPLWLIPRNSRRASRN